MSAIKVGDTPVTGIAYDSRRVTANCVYVGLPGAKTHGAKFARDAKAAGAAVLLTDAEGAVLAADAGLPIVVDADPRVTMAGLAARLAGDPTADRPTFGVTGTSGKTTTCLMLDAALRGLGRHAGYVGTIGFTLDGQQLPLERNTVTTPESVDLQAILAQMAGLGADTFVMEATSMGLAMHRVTGVHFDVVGFTNLGRDHLDFHGTVENYFEAKARLFEPGWAKTAVVNIDDPAGRRLAARIGAAGAPSLVTVGRDDDATIVIVDRTPQGRSQLVTYRAHGESGQLNLDLPGAFNAANAMLALGMLDAAGWATPDALAGLSHATAPGRMQRVELGPDAPQVFVDFGHTPEATAAALEAAGHPVIAVLGAGGDRDPGKRELMGAAAARLSDIVIVTDDNYRNEDPALIRAAVCRGAKAAAGPGVQVIDVAGRPEAVRQAIAMADSSWNVVVLGRGVETYQEVEGGRRIPMVDADLVVSAWGGR